MIKGIYSVARGMVQRSQNIDIIANNIANINTTAYKREIPFSEYINEAGEAQFKKLTSMQQGETVLTSNPLDVAISGRGFFMIKNSDGQYELTRDGRFRLSDDGYIVDGNGNKVQGKSGEIYMGELIRNKDSEIKISNNGEIRVGNQFIDTILVVDVEFPESLSRIGASNFLLGNQPFKELNEDDFKLAQGYLEESNTNPILEMEAMIALNKSYETSQKIINALDQSLDHANQIGKI
ncbi:Flagellar basal body rod protein [Melioribacter roseus P3M-2]|uniref:Flagellar basal body rod protein n=1 Tax=Melioribacter roseus (strain DSM 23840 / JCM 17771 / VKM B-2668 / P3M-2) TaxID=1191523 RepID=I6Z882_MELRP|nr:flagellar hook basal-body protein [Melioribacter roseus]AFN75385.1 Flagellar basal body rod protein [Melioribacter roseus P3M-2]